MPAERIAMRRIREVLRLKHECDLSHSQIAQALRISKGTVSNYLTQAEGAGITHSVSLGLDDAALSGELKAIYERYGIMDKHQAKLGIR